MPDPVATAEYQARMRVEQSVYDLAVMKGVNPEEALESVRAFFTVADRLEAWDMITPFIDGVELPVPTVGTINGITTGLFYRDHINMVWGDDGQGKSLLIDQVTFVERSRGHKVMILEAEELTPLTRVARWEEESDHHQRITLEDVAGVIVFPVHRSLSPENVDMFATIIKAEDVSVVFIDSLGTMMANMGFDENKAADVYHVKERILDPLAAAGAAVVVIDHVTKSDGEKPKSIGSTRKRSMLSGVGYEMRIPEGGGFSRRKAGSAELRCYKDRHGTYNRSELVAVMWIAPAVVAGYLRIDIEAPEDLLPDAPSVENRQNQARDMLAEIETEMRAMPLTAVTVKTFLHLEFKKDAQALLDEGVAANRWMYSKEHNAYVLLSSLMSS